MKKASITEAKNRLSALIDEVRHGKSVLITDRGRPVARLESVLSGLSEDDEGRLARLERQGVLRRALAPPPKDLATAKLPRLERGGSLAEMILQERRESR